VPLEMVLYERGTWPPPSPFGYPVMSPMEGYIPPSVWGCFGFAFEGFFALFGRGVAWVGRRGSLGSSVMGQWSHGPPLLRRKYPRNLLRYTKESVRGGRISPEKIGLFEGSGRPVRESPRPSSRWHEAARGNPQHGPDTHLHGLRRGPLTPPGKESSLVFFRLTGRKTEEGIRYVLRLSPYKGETKDGNPKPNPKGV